jgi:hypothetical protein
LRLKADKTSTIHPVIERLLALRLAEEALECRERRLLLRDQRLALRVDFSLRIALAIAGLAIVVSGAAR